MLDRGDSYRPVIYYSDEAEREAAENSKQQLQASGPFRSTDRHKDRTRTTFYPAEEYHQDYYKKNKIHYQLYREGSGRAGFLRKNWKD